MEKLSVWESLKEERRDRYGERASGWDPLNCFADYAGDASRISACEKERELPTRAMAKDADDTVYYGVL